MPRSPLRWLVWLGGVPGLVVGYSALAQQSVPPPLPEVTIQAQREALEPRVRAFVNRSLYLENDEGEPLEDVWSCSHAERYQGVYRNASACSRLVQLRGGWFR